MQENEDIAGSNHQNVLSVVDFYSDQNAECDVFPWLYVYITLGLSIFCGWFFPLAEMIKWFLKNVIKKFYKEILPLMCTSLFLFHIGIPLLIESIHLALFIICFFQTESLIGFYIIIGITGSVSIFRCIRISYLYTIFLEVDYNEHPVYSQAEILDQGPLWELMLIGGSIGPLLIYSIIETDPVFWKTSPLWEICIISGTLVVGIVRLVVSFIVILTWLWNKKQTEGYTIQQTSQRRNQNVYVVSSQKEKQQQGGGGGGSFQHKKKMIDFIRPTVKACRQHKVAPRENRPLQMDFSMGKS